MVAVEVALGGDLRISAYGFPPEDMFSLQMRKENTTTRIEGVTLQSDASGVIAPVTVPLPPRLAAGGGYSLEAIRLRDGTVLATARITVHPAPVVTLSPRRGPPGSTVQVIVENLFPGSLQVNFGEVAVIGPLSVSGSTYTGFFLVPDSSPGVAKAVTAFNRVGERLTGRGQTSFTPEARFPWENIEVRDLTIPDGMTLAAGQAFVLWGRLEPPPPDPGQVQIAPFWQSEHGFQIPIGLNPAQIQPNGVFAVAARAPSLLQGDPFPIRTTDKVGITLTAADAVAVQQSSIDVQNYLPTSGPFSVVAVKDMPDDPEQDGDIIPNVPVPGPGEPSPIQVIIEPLGAFSTILTGTVDINGIVPVLDVKQPMLQLELSQQMTYLQHYITNCMLHEEISPHVFQWNWAIQPDESVILSQLESVANPFVDLAKFNSINQFGIQPASQPGVMPGGDNGHLPAWNRLPRADQPET